MNRVNLSSSLEFSRIIYGMWRLTDDVDTSIKHIDAKINSCLDQGITTFDESPQRIGMKAISNIIALIICKPMLSTILAKFMQSSCILCDAPSTLASIFFQKGV